jgi:hypothetical protein
MLDIFSIPKKANSIATAEKVYIGCVFIFNNNCDNCSTERIGLSLYLTIAFLARDLNANFTK